MYFVLSCPAPPPPPPPPPTHTHTHTPTILRRVFEYMRTATDEISLNISCLLTESLDTTECMDSKSPDDTLRMLRLF